MAGLYILFPTVASAIFTIARRLILLVGWRSAIAYLIEKPCLLHSLLKLVIFLCPLLAQALK